MANLFENKDRRVIPNWREFNKTVILGELDFYQDTPVNNPEIFVDEYIHDWVNNKSIIYAGELLSAALVNNVKHHTEIQNAAEFILENPNASTISQISLADRVLGNGNNGDASDEEILEAKENILDLDNIAIIRQKISYLRSSLRNLPTAIAYVEISRCFSILGLKEKAAEAMRIALHMGKGNRFVLRSATRLFLHHGDFEKAHDILRKDPLTQFDPWLIAAEISVSMMQNRSSRLIKKGLEMINSRNISPFNFTELASSIGTVEMSAGKTKKSRQLFSKALIKPNDNSLAQIEWASHKDGQAEFNAEALVGVNLNYEALAFKNYHSGQYGPALNNAIKWFNDMPYTKRPIMFASSMASTILNDQKTAITLVSAGLVSHPNDPSLLNNLAYAYALNNQPNKALEALASIKIETEIDDNTKICLIATKGLIMYRNGNHKIGRELYFDAFDKTRGINNHILNWKAILNYAREEIRIGSNQLEYAMEAVAKIPTVTDDIQIDIIRKEVISKYNEYKESLIGQLEN